MREANWTPVLVYGSLLRGHHNHERWIETYMKRGEMIFVGVGRTTRNFRLLDLGQFPGARPWRHGWPLEGEVYLVSDWALAELDRHEGCPVVYERRTFNTTLGRADVYVYHGHKHRLVVPMPVRGGCWRTHLRKRRVKEQSRQHTSLFEAYDNRVMRGVPKHLPTRVLHTNFHPF